MSYGLGLRPAHYEVVLNTGPSVDFFEALSEDYIDLTGPDFLQLQKIRQRYPIALHGVGLSIGSTDPLNLSYLQSLKKLSHVIQPLWISDHFCWTGIQGMNTHDLLPLPYTEEMISHIVSRIIKVQDFLGQQLLFENVSSYAQFSVSQMTEWEFISEIARRADCFILLDVNNIYVNAVNHFFNPEDFLKGISQDRVKQFHLSGHQHCGTHIIDTHDAAISEIVWNLYEKADYLFPNTPLIIERDAHIPPISELIGELHQAKNIKKINASKSAQLENQSLKKPLAKVMTVKPTRNLLTQLQENFQAYLLRNEMEITAFIANTKKLSAESCLQIYQNSYYERMINALSQDYPVLKAAIGDEAFSGLVIDYIKAYPSRDFNLRGVGKYLSDFILSKNPDFLVYADLAKLEGFICEAEINFSKKQFKTQYNVFFVWKNFQASAVVIDFSLLPCEAIIQVHKESIAAPVEIVFLDDNQLLKSTETHIT